MTNHDGRLDPATLRVGQVVHVRAYLIGEPSLFPLDHGEVDRLLAAWETRQVLSEVPPRDQTPVYATSAAAIAAGIDYERQYARDLLAACERAEAALGRRLARLGENWEAARAGQGSGAGREASSGDDA